MMIYLFGVMMRLVINNTGSTNMHNTNIITTNLIPSFKN